MDAAQRLVRSAHAGAVLSAGDSKQHASKMDGCPRDVCRHFQKTGSCGYGDECKYAHEVANSTPHGSRYTMHGGANMLGDMTRKSGQEIGRASCRERV